MHEAHWLSLDSTSKDYTRDRHLQFLDPTTAARNLDRARVSEHHRDRPRKDPRGSRSRGEPYSHLHRFPGPPSEFSMHITSTTVTRVDRSNAFPDAECDGETVKVSALQVGVSYNRKRTYITCARREPERAGEEAEKPRRISGTRGVVLSVSGTG